MPVNNRWGRQVVCRTKDLRGGVAGVEHDEVEAVRPAELL